jgi:hypothetical protein
LIYAIGARSMGRPVEPNLEADPVRRILVLLAIIAALFLALPPTPAMAWSSVPFLLLGALFIDAYRSGRRQLLSRESGAGADTVVQASRLFAGMMLFDAVWLGLSGNASAMADSMSVHGMDGGADLGGLDMGSLDMGSHLGGFDAGGDAGGMGGMGGGF